MAKPTVKASQLTNKNVHADIKGTRLAAHLMDIQKRFGNGDEVIRELAAKALANPYGHGSPEGGNVLTAIRDRLLHHSQQPTLFADADPHGRSTKEYASSARDLATSINWHRVANKLDLDSRIESTLRSWAKEGVDHKTLMRTAHDLAQDNLKRTDPATRKLLNALQRHAQQNWKGLRSGYGGDAEDFTHEELAKSIERLANREGYKEQLEGRGDRQLKEGRETVGAKPLPSDPANPTPADAIDTLNWLPGKGPAYTRRGRGHQIHEGLDAEQYHKLSDQLLRFAGLGKSNQGLGGVYWRQTPESYADPAHPAHIERMAVGRLLHELGVIDLHSHDIDNGNARKIHEYTSALHNLIHHEPGDLLSDHYRKFIRQVSNRTPHVELYMQGLRPLVNWAVVKKFGERTWDQIQNRNRPAEIDLAQPGYDADADLPIAEEVRPPKKRKRPSLKVDGKAVPDSDVIRVEGLDGDGPVRVQDPNTRRLRKVPPKLLDGQIKVPTTEALKKFARAYNQLLKKFKSQ